MDAKAYETNKIVSIIILGIIISFTYSLPLIKEIAVKNMSIKLISNDFINSILIYQIITIFMAMGVMLLIYSVANNKFMKYFKIGRINSKVETEKFIGLNPKDNENWLSIGINFTIIISIVTGIVIYFQAIKNNAISSENFIYIPFIVVFSLMNSFTEEIITRFGVVVALDGIIHKQAICITSALIFGTVHYFGTPGGILGVLLAGFLGWLLSKSIIETQGLFWSLVIHCIQDIIIFTGLFFVMI